MAEIAPFRGLRYAPTLRQQLVYSPPYDVIDPMLRQKLVSASPYNVVHVTLGSDNTPADWYAQAARTFRRWQTDGILVREEAAALYAYEQTFYGPDSQRLTRRGFFARVRLVPWGQGIHPHEKTHSGPKADRLQLMRALHAQESPVFGLYRDPESVVDALLGTAPSDAPTVTDDYGVHHTCWPLTHPDLLSQTTAFLKERDLVIADGHHRYETALAYRDEVRARNQQNANKGPHDYVLMYLTAAESAGLVILPTHRVVTAPSPCSETQLCAALATDFILRRVADDDDLANAISVQRNGELILGMRLRSGAWTLTLRDRKRAHMAVPAGQPQELAELDVCVLQNLVLAPHLGISAETLAHGDAVRYTIHSAEACQAVRDGHASAAFLLNPTNVEQVWCTAVAGVTMPQKSTYFFPKLLTGLVMNPLED